MRVKDITSINGFKLINGSDITIDHFSISTNDIKGKTIFFPLKGKTDGHNYILNGVEGGIAGFFVAPGHDEIIKKAVLNHNRLKIQDGLTEKELLFAKIIRDADKLDIFYTITIDKFPAIFWYKDFDDEKISDELMNDFKSKKALNYQKIHTNADMIVIFYAYIFDIYFKSTLNI